MSVAVPQTTWETKEVTQTVYEPQVVTRNVPVHETVYVPQTRYILQSRVRGRWNPFRQPVTTYEYRPVTSWVPTTRTVNQAITSQQWVARQRTVQVPTPVQRTVAQQQLVQTEIPQPAAVGWDRDHRAKKAVDSRSTARQTARFTLASAADGQWTPPDWHCKSNCVRTHGQL